jgi:hypothetical protein
VSILSTFKEQVLHLKVFCTDFMFLVCINFFVEKALSKKAARKMLVKLTRGRFEQLGSLRREII